MSAETSVGPVTGTGDRRARLPRRGALVTGVGNLVAAAIATRLADSGATVWVGDADPSISRRLSGAIVGARAVELDPCNESHWEALMAELEEQRQTLDLVVNAAQDFNYGAIEHTSPEAFMDTFNSVGHATWLAQRFAIAHMRAAGGGTIVNVTSVLARVAASGCAANCAAARGVLMSTKSAALECARDASGIVINAVLVGRIEGDPAHFPDASVLPHAPEVKPADVAGAVWFLATDGAAYMTGAEVPVDGGYLAG